MRLTIVISTILPLYAISFLVYGNGNSPASFVVYAQSDLQTIKYRNLVINLGNGLKTNAQLTFPATGEGPYPGVLLIHGSGPTDMNETVHGSQPFWQISKYLSERGFVVLKYNKRGIGHNVKLLTKKYGKMLRLII